MGSSENVKINDNTSPNELPRVAQREAWIQKGTFRTVGGKTSTNLINNGKSQESTSSGNLYSKKPNVMARTLSSKNPNGLAIAYFREEWSQKTSNET